MSTLNFLLLIIILCEDALVLTLKYLGLKGCNVCNSFSNRKKNNLHLYVKYIYSISLSIFNDPYLFIYLSIYLSIYLETDTQREIQRKQM